MPRGRPLNRDLCAVFRSAARHGAGALLASLLLGGMTAGAQVFTPGVATAVPTGQASPAVSMPTLQTSQNPIFGSVSSGKPTPGVLTLTPLDAIDRGLKYNLSLLLSEQATETARGARLRALADVLPTLSGRVSETVQQVNLASFGFPGIPGIPPIVGPFAVFDMRLLSSGPLLDLHALNLLRSRGQEVTAAQFNYQNVRDLIVLVVGGAYMQALSGEARIAAVESQLKTAEALYRQAYDMKNAGVVPGIDVLRSQVEMQVQQQRLLAARNDFAKEKLALGRLIGLPAAQEFTFAGQIPLTPQPPITLDEALERAYRDRPDYHGAEALLRSAELNRKAAIDQRLPSIRFNADYGTLGARPTQTHPTYTTVAGLQIPIFQGGKTRGDILQADALLNRRRDELNDLRGRIEFEVRTSFLDLTSSWEQVQVARSSVDLAQQAFNQAQDRFRAGVTTTVEVVQAQEAIAATNENYITSTFAYNVAKLSLSRSLGIAERAVKDFLGGKQ